MADDVSKSIVDIVDTVDIVGIIDIVGAVDIRRLAWPLIGEDARCEM